ncbi:glycosyltransferase involved in cell wall biosynthesis [Aquimarina sp. EL_43]|uniref:glycosyltransferase family 2 protein n=1 Tax=unclassified Aquimarina TaxID=2627091 RepID=UPI0018CB59B6|nr:MULTISPECIES: glycosyltransferase family A protein [unclassified Aquimarina]MBG6133664.1 glycosyltransferase involved in cell wall biosynthesis [Aquimarina sp. EL_35]MBG6153865.1 glycosyltransferase involved in cell wall biosynthesis [Aquimarina sp. EL_32]MBG6172037.1 glycosyltransferase involved in cell wall biosynthesis [Aquimarina sp. EL_43]
MKTITVFTPTYNRAYCLHKCYESLIKQSNQDFVWLIIDDGSSDNTKELVTSWINENKIDIQYHYQKNLGMHGGHNAAYRLIETTLNVCIDSDDFVGEEAIQKILDSWETIKGKPEYAGLVGLDADESGAIIGTKIPEGIKETTMYELYNTHKVLGDKKLVYRTEVVKKYPPYPIFEGERFVPLGYLYQLIDQDYKLLPVNEVFCVVEYMVDGSSMNMLKQYRRHPRGFAFSRKSRMQLATNFKDKFKNAIHYVSSSLFIKNGSFLKESPKKITTILAIPFGIVLNLYIRYKTKEGI